MPIAPAMQLTSGFGAVPPLPAITIDAEIPLSILSLKLVEQIGQLEPYGNGNPQPLFLAGDLQVVGEPRLVGNDRHLSFRVRQQGRELKAIAFNMADRLEELMSAGGACCLVFTPMINEWQGWSSVELLVKDLQPGPDAPPSSRAGSRVEMLKGNEYLRVWINRAGVNYLIHMPPA